MTRRRAVATATTVLKRLRYGVPGRCGGGSVEATAVMTRSWFSSAPTDRDRALFHTIGSGAPRRGFTCTSCAWASLEATGTTSDTPTAVSKPETSGERFVRWQTRRAELVRVSAAARWQLPENDKALDLATARAILNETHDRQVAGATNDSKTAVEIAQAFVNLTTLASHPDPGWRCSELSDAKAVAHLFRDVRFAVPKHLPRTNDLQRIIHQFTESGVWDIAMDATRVLRAHDMSASSSEEEKEKESVSKLIAVDAAATLEALGSGSALAWQVMRDDFCVGGGHSKAHNWGTGDGDPSIRLYHTELWRGSKGKDPRDELFETDVGVGALPKSNRATSTSPEKSLRAAAAWVMTLGAFGSAARDDNYGASLGNALPTDDVATELIFQNLAIKADDATRALLGERAGYLVSRRRLDANGALAADAGGKTQKTRRRKKKKARRAKSETVPTELDGAFDDRDVDDADSNLTPRAAHHKQIRDSLRHMRALAESYDTDSDLNARAMPPPIEIACVVNALLKARGSESLDTATATRRKGKGDAAFPENAFETAEANLCDFESCVDALCLWRLALAAGSSETGAYREKFFPHQVWARDDWYEREVFNPASEKFRRQVRTLVDAVGESAKRVTRDQGETGVVPSVRAARTATHALDAFAHLAHRGLPVRRLVFDRVAAFAMHLVERACPGETFALFEFDLTETCAHALRAFQTIAERQHEGRVFDATVAKWCRVSAATLSDTSKPKRGDRNKQTCESLGMLLAACGSFAGRCGISGDVNALVVAVNETIASDTVSFGKNATAHDAQRVLVGWRKIKLNAVSSSPNPNAVAAVIASVKRVLPQELDSQTIHDIVSGLAALSGSEITLAEATQATLRRRARDDAHAAASRLCLQGLRAFDEPVAPADLAESALLATLQTAKAANHLEGAYIAKAARAWARLAHAAGNFPDPSAVATTLAALHDAQPPASTADLRMIERAVLDLETMRLTGETGRANPPEETLTNAESNAETHTADTGRANPPQETHHTIPPPISDLFQRWLAASPAKQAAALVKKWESADSADARAQALLAAARADTTKVRKALREEILGQV